MKVLLQFVSILLFAAVGTSGQYHTLTDLGQPNPDATLGNPMRGLAESPRYTWPPYDSQVPLSLEFYYVGEYSKLNAQARSNFNASQPLRE